MGVLSMSAPYLLVNEQKNTLTIMRPIVRAQRKKILVSIV